MNKKVISLVALALLAYGIFVALVVNFYDDSPMNMKWEDRESYNRQYVTKVKLDQLNIDKIITDLGSPDITEAKKVDDTHYQLMYYRTQHMKSDGITTEDECTALLFKNDLLNAIGESAIEQYHSVK